MYKVLKSVISDGGFKLADIQHKVKKLYATGDLTEEQMDELLDMASMGVSPEAERPEVLQILHNLDDRIKALEDKLKGHDGESEEPAEYEQWQPWDGISNKYQQGAVVIHNGVIYESIHPGQNVWEPGAAGTSNMWVKRE